MSAKRTARVHFLGSMIFDVNRVNPNTVRLNPKIFNKKGKATKAPNVKMRFFHFICEGEKIGFSLSLPARWLGTSRWIKEQIPSKEAARKGMRPPPGLEKLPNDAFREEIITAPTKKRKTILDF